MLLRRLQSGWCWERSHKDPLFVSQYQCFLLSTLQMRVSVGMPVLISDEVCYNGDKQSPSVCWHHAAMPSGRQWLKGRHHPWATVSKCLEWGHWWLSCIVEKRAKAVAFPGLKMPHLISWFSGGISGESPTLSGELGWPWTACWGEGSGFPPVGGKWVV